MGITRYETALELKTALLGEIEDVLRTTPKGIFYYSEDVIAWLGRAIAAIGRWKPAAGARANECLQQFIESRTGFHTEGGFHHLMVLLHQARNDLRFITTGPINVVIDQGQVFDYFDEVRKILELVYTDVLFADPYLDGDFVSRYIPHLRPSVSIRLLTSQLLPKLMPAVRLFSQQHNARIEVRTSQFHDRFVFIDRGSCYQSGASFKDGGRKAPTTITQITDAFPAIHKTYEDMWLSGKVET